MFDMSGAQQMRFIDFRQRAGDMNMREYNGANKIVAYRRGAEEAKHDARPEIQNLLQYVRRHYENGMISELSRKIEEGDIGVESQGRIVYNTEQDDICLKPQEGSVIEVDARRDGYYMVNVRACIVMNIKCLLAGEEQCVSQKYRASLWLDMENGIQGEYGNFRIYRYEEPEDGVPLDQYLIPILRLNDIELEAEQIIGMACGKEVNEPKWLQAGQISAALGLRILELPLYERADTASILFFREGEVLAWITEEQKGIHHPQKVHIDARTIVINSNSSCRSGKKDAIFHECFHYVEHRLFFQMQNMHNDDARQMDQEGQVHAQHEDRSPMEWIEWQARYGSQCLQMPQKLLRMEIEKEMDRLQGNCTHIGHKLEMIGRRLARKFGVPNYRMRNRMIHVGYPAAKGALNFVNGGYIRPFAFALSECYGSKSFVISMANIVCEYERNETFRKLIDTGKYIYVEGHLCINAPEYVVQTGCSARMTEWANEHVDQCCLRFEVAYVRDHQAQYTFGQMNSDEEYNKRNLTLSLSVVESGKSMMDNVRAVANLLMDLPRSFSATLRSHMERCGVTAEELAEMMGISVRSVHRLRNEERGSYSLDQVVVLCLALHLPPEFSADMIEKAGLRMRNRPEDLVYGVLLRTMYMEPLGKIQETLRRCGGPELPIKEAV